MWSRCQISRQTQTETHRHTYTRVCVEDACAACGAANVGATLGGNFAYTPLCKRRILWSLAEQFGCIREVSEDGARQAKRKANGAIQSRENADDSFN